MLEEEDLESCAQAVVTVLRIAGATPRCEVLGMLLDSLHLTASDAEAVIGHALTRNLLEASGDVLRIADHPAS